MSARPCSMMRAAVGYATRLGWPVFPLLPRGKDPLIPSWRGGRGFLDATTDRHQIEQWWRTRPRANIGIACCEFSNLLTLDIDPRHGGDDELAELEARYGELPKTPIGLTGGGGQHYIFRRPPGVRFRGQLAPGIDVKANGYIVAPPSIHPETGQAYGWDAGAHPADTPIAELPSWVLGRILSYDFDDYGQPADDAAKSFLARAFAHAGLLGTRIDAVRINARCPWEKEHTQQSGSGGSVIFAPKQGSAAGWFHCSHTSHGRKTLQDVLAALPVEACLRADADICEENYETAERAAIEAEGG